MNNLLSYCGLVAARISSSDKDLPVHIRFHNIYTKKLLICDVVRENIISRNITKYWKNRKCEFIKFCYIVFFRPLALVIIIDNFPVFSFNLCPVDKRFIKKVKNWGLKCDFSNKTSKIPWNIWFCMVHCRIGTIRNGHNWDKIDMSKMTHFECRKGTFCINWIK